SLLARPVDLDQGNGAGGGKDLGRRPRSTSRDGRRSRGARDDHQLLQESMLGSGGTVGGRGGEGKEGGSMTQGGEASNFPRCRECEDGELVPLSDFGAQGAPVHFKAWVCVNPQCGFNIKIRNGDVLINEPINDARTE